MSSVYYNYWYIDLSLNTVFYVTVYSDGWPFKLQHLLCDGIYSMQYAQKNILND